MNTGKDAAFRLVHGILLLIVKKLFTIILETGDGLPGLAIEIYASYAQIQTYSLFWKPFLPFIAESIINELGVKGVYLKQRIRGRPQVSRRIFYSIIF